MNQIKGKERLILNQIIKIELFSANDCNRCTKAKAEIRSNIEQINQGGKIQLDYQELDVVESLDYAVELGVLSTPAIAIDGVLVFAAMPSMKKLISELKSRQTVNGKDD